MGNPLTERMRPLLAGCLLAASVTAAMASDDRKLSMHNVNTGENISVVYKRDGEYVEGSLKSLDWFLRDWRKGQAKKMDRRLFDVVWEVYSRSGATVPIEVHSGYRSRATNAALRERSRGVALHSQHTNGAAMDFHIPGVPLEKLREISMKMQDGGVGYYPDANTPFVHVDVAGVRHWPRMTRSQLAQLFPDGSSAFLPSDGRPLKGFKDALASIARKKADFVAHKASEAFAALVPEFGPVPEWKPGQREVDAAAGIPGTDPFPMAAYAHVPADPDPPSAFDRLLSPSFSMPTAMAATRRPLADLVTEASRLQPPAVRRTGAGKGPRLAAPGAGQTRKDAVQPKWKIGGFL